MRPINKIKPRWSKSTAYLVGLITTDGSLSKDGRHIAIISKDKNLLEKIKERFNLNITISPKLNAYTKRKDCYIIQFGDIIFYQWLLKIGLMPNKTKIISELKIPNKFFFDFLRGHFDGDGSFYSYWDPRWKSSFMFYLTFISASQNHIEWLQRKISELLKINGCIKKDKNVFSLRFAKRESLKLIRKFYQDENLIYLERKQTKIMKALTQDK